MQTSGDTGSGETGVNLSGHASGDPLSASVSGGVTVGHTWIIIVIALALLWLLGGVAFKGIRM
jgi:amino acid transporter